MRSGLGGLWARLRGPRRPVEDVVRELRTVSGGLLEKVMPPPRWDELVPALDKALEGWLAAEGGSRTAQVVVGPPGSGVGDVVESWARERGARLLPAPEAAAILQGGQQWLEALGGEGDGVLVVPRLEHCYLRHARGFGLVRALLGHIAEGRDRVLVGCDSWAFEFLDRAVGMRTVLPRPLALAACFAPDLESWFRRVAAAAGVAAFRRADSGATVLACEADVENAAPSEVLQRLAVASRGIPGVAWAIWRESLRISVDEEVDEKSWAAAAADRGHTVWVRPSADAVEAPAGLGRTAVWTLHALLLHGGLATEALSAVLPAERSEIVAAVATLGRLGLVERVGDRWRVTLVAYPAVRRRLADEDLLVDGC